MCKCQSIDCVECCIRKLPKAPKPKKAKKLKTVQAKCGLCRRKLIPGDSWDYCMTCKYNMDQAGR